MTEPITPDEIAARVEALHAEIHELRGLVHGTGAGPNSNELHDFLASLDRHFNIQAPNLSAYRNQLAA